MAAGDLDGDGQPDVVATSDNANGELLVFHNLPTGLDTPVVVPTGSDPRDVHLVDMNADGKLDAVLANASLVGSLSVLYNRTVPSSTALTFEQPVTYPQTGTRPSAIAIADTNQDNVPDVAVGYAGSESLAPRGPAAGSAAHRQRPHLAGRAVPHPGRPVLHLAGAVRGRDGAWQTTPWSV